MIDFTKIQFERIFIHHVGNKLRDEGLKIGSKDISFTNKETNAYFLKYCISSFANNEVYNFTHNTELSLNEIYLYAKRVFSSPDNLYKTSIDVAKHLYENSTHPKTNGGELCICYFKNCILDGIPSDAIGLFKSEEKDIFLKFDSVSSNIKIKHDSGINIKKLDKGCLIFNLEENNGYKVCIIDSNKSNDTQYWKNDFLNIKPASDNYHLTKNFLSITKDYIAEQLPEEFDMSKPDRIDLLNRSIEYFKTHESFNKKEFEKEILQDTEMIKSFRNFGSAFKKSNPMEVSDTFEISPEAVKKQSKIFKSVLKLDKNFHIYIHGNRQLIEKGTETDGRTYYKIYYNEET